MSLLTPEERFAADLWDGTLSFDAVMRQLREFAVDAEKAWEEHEWEKQQYGRLKEALETLRFEFGYLFPRGR